ncbi:uncharacterized protein LOC5573893 [Aedes aegypti]|uniref:CUB domain-containing protein n=1 Tax=Aedes aegypti TaxID=7159 RepID=A0A1S4F113_AEDAE|nr:uncharacterized protein LOC5573893 [Aedes aegypti]
MNMANAVLRQKTIRTVLIWCLLELVVRFVHCDEDFRMVNQYEELGKNDNYSRVSYYVASERSSVECGGVFKRLQNEIMSPGYPDQYGEELRCEYTFKSPFVCSSQYHFQFLDFALEPSRNCYKDRLVIGDEEILCGTVLGSKTYNSTDGILKIKFVTDGWGSDRGFRLVVTRQPCEDNEATETSTSYTVYTTIEVAEETTDPAVTEENGYPTINGTFSVSSRQDIPPEFSPGGNGYLPPSGNTVPPYYPPTNVCPPACNPYPNCYPYNPGTNYPSYPIPIPMTPSYPNYPGNSYPVYPNSPSYPNNPPTYPPSYPNYPNNPTYPGAGTPIYPNPNCQYTPCTSVNPTNPNPSYPSYPTYPPNSGGGTNSIGGAPPGYQPSVLDPEIELAENTSSSKPQRQDIPVPPFLPPILPGLPQCCRNVFNQKRFYLVSPNFPSYETFNRDCAYQIYRFSPNTCRLVISFKYFLLGDDRLNCADAFLEIDGRRICGCRSGMVYTTQWSNVPKIIRVRTVRNRFPNVQGFVLDIFQESCPYRLVRSQPALLDRSDNFHAQQLAPLNVTTVQTNSSTTYSYYFYNMDQPAKLGETKAATTAKGYPEGPSSKFFYPSTVQPYAACQFNALDWLRLKVESLWVVKPRCY